MQLPEKIQYISVTCFPFFFPHLLPSIRTVRLKNISLSTIFLCWLGLFGAQRTSSMCILNDNINFDVTIHAKNILSQ